MKNDLPHLLIPLSLLLVGLATTSVVGAQGSVTVHEEKEPIIQSFDTRLITGLMYYNYSDTTFEDQFSDNIPFYGFGASYGISSPIGNISVDAYIQRTDKGKDGFFEEHLDDIYRPPVNTDARFNRDDYAITMNYQFGSIYGWQIPLFVGYKWGETTLERTEISLSTDFYPLAQVKTNFNTEGPVVGAGITFPIAKNKKHRAGIYGAYGILTGEHKQTIRGGGDIVVEAIPYTDTTYTWKVGINFNGELVKLPIGKLNYTISLDSYSYTMDLFMYETDSPLEEEIHSVNASVNWAF